MNSGMIIFQFASFLLGLLAIAILLWVNQDASHSKRLLILLLAIFVIITINGLGYQTGLYLTFPQFHKLLHPFSLLIAPVSYLYIRSVVLHEYKFRKYDWLVLIPALLFALNLLPYYLMPFSEKQAHVVQYYQDSTFRTLNKNGILPSYTFPFIRFIWSLYFVIQNHRIIKKFLSRATSKTLADNTATIRWIKSLNVMLTALLLISLVSAIVTPIFKTDFEIPDISVAAFTLAICTTLFVKPKILYGLHMPSSATLVREINEIEVSSATSLAENKIDSEEKSVKVKETTSISSVEARNYKMMIETFFNSDKPFLNSEYTLHQLVIDLKIPRYTLSAFINREYNVGFREFLNRYRIEYMLANLNKPEWRQFTLEAIAEECGFSSRTTFIKNFKEITGDTPSAYLKKFNQVEVDQILSMLSKD